MNFDILESIPYSIHWDITNACNYRCNHCGADDICLNETSELSFEDIKKVVNNLKTDRPMLFSLFGGEPLIREDIIGIIDLIQSRLDNSGISITTNGSFLKKYAKELLDRDIAITVSLDGITAATNDKVRGEGTFANTFDNLKYLIDQRNRHAKSKTTIGLAYTITSVYTAPEDLIQFCETCEIDQLVISAIGHIGNAKKNTHLLIDTPTLLDYIEKLFILKQNTQVDVDADLGYPIFTKYFNAKYGASLPYKYVGCKTGSSG